MGRLPDEIWVQVCDYLDPSDLLSLQCTSRQLLKIGRDASLWKAKCFEKAPSAVHAFANGDSLSDLLNGLSFQAPKEPHSNPNNLPTVTLSRRSRAIMKWDCTHPNERIDWYTDYIGRNAPLSIDWQHHPPGNEIRSMALFGNDREVLGAMEDGSLQIWNVRTSLNGLRSLRSSARSQPGLLFANLAAQSGSSKATRTANIGTAVDSTVIHHSGGKAYIAVEDQLNEVDLHTLSLVSQQQFAWKITAISQQSNAEIPLMIGTSFTLNMHDPRIPLRHQVHALDTVVDFDEEDRRTVFLPNYAKDRPSMQLPRIRSRQQSSSVMQNVVRQLPPTNSMSRSSFAHRRAHPEAYAPVEPGPQTILHRGANEIIVAGRMPSILFYDKRSFPQLHSVIHSGARLSSLTTLNYPPNGATSFTAQATLIAAGEYHGRGSLELYELPHHRPSDRRASYDWPEELDEGDNSNSVEPAADAGSSETPNASHSDAPYNYRNRQSSSSAKLLSVATQGARIVYSDSEGAIKWVERDGRGLARRWNINSYRYTQTGGAVIGDSVARKIVTFASDETHSTGNLAGLTSGDGDLLVWTGNEIGLVTTKVKGIGHDELVAAFEEKMSLEDNPDFVERRRSREEAERQEEEYGRTMRRALERQADERRFLARFGRMGSS